MPNMTEILIDWVLVLILAGLGLWGFIWVRDNAVPFIRRVYRT